MIGDSYLSSHLGAVLVFFMGVFDPVITHRLKLQFIPSLLLHPQFVSLVIPINKSMHTDLSLIQLANCRELGEDKFYLIQAQS